MCVLTPHFVNSTECMRRWNELQTRDTNANTNSPTSQWTFEEVGTKVLRLPTSVNKHDCKKLSPKKTKLTLTMYQFNRTHSHRASVSSSASSSDFHHDSPTYSSPYGSLSDPMVDDFLHDVGHMSPHNTHYDSMDIDPSRLHSAGPGTIDPRQANMHQDLDAFIDFDAERAGRTFEVRHATPTNGQHFDPNDWSWFDNMVTGPNGHPHQHHPAGFLTDTHPSELSHDSPGALDSGPSSYSR